MFIAKGYAFPESYSLPSKLLASPAIHLWFLPFIFLSLVIIDNHRQTLSRKWVATAIGVAAIAAICSAPLWRELDYLPPLGQYFHALPAVLIGIFFGAMTGLGAGARRVLLCGIGISVLIMTLKSQAGMGVTYLVGLAPCIFLFYGRTEKKRKGSFLLSISSATFGVYLLHVFGLMILRFSGVGGILLPLLAFLLTLVVVMALRAYLPAKYVRYLM